nr:hypothetical protein [Streptococcus himalayensis]
MELFQYTSLWSGYFPHKSRSDLIMKMRIGKVELSLFQSLHQETLETILDKVLAYEHSTQ